MVEVENLLKIGESRHKADMAVETSSLVIQITQPPSIAEAPQCSPCLSFHKGGAGTHMSHSAFD